MTLVQHIQCNLLQKYGMIPKIRTTLQGCMDPLDPKYEEENSGQETVNVLVGEVGVVDVG